MSQPTQVAVVTGAGRGIGRAIAISLAASGRSVALLSRSVHEIEAVAQEIKEYGGSALPLRCDVSSPEEVDQAFAATRSELGDPCILVAAAGIAMAAPFHKTSLAQWQQTIAVNLTGAFLCTQAALPSMRTQPFGRIIYIASTAAQKGYAYTSAYCASKHGLLGLTRALALELAETHITANAICPGFTDTEMAAESIRNIVAKTKKSEAEARKILESLSPQKRFTSVEEIAATAIFLCRDEARGITGQSLMIAGGEVMV